MTTKIQALLDQADAQFSQEQWAEAQENYQRVLSHEKNNVYAMHRLALLFVRLGQLQQAQRYFEYALQLNANNPLLQTHFANLMRQLNQEVLAIKHYELALTCDPNCAEAQNNLGNIFFKRGDYSQAIQYYQKAVNSKHDYSDALYNLGAALIKTNELAQAREVWAELIAVGADPRIIFNVQYNLGELALQEQNYQDAITHYLAAQHLDQSAVDVVRRLAICYMNSDDVELAGHCYETLLNAEQADLVDCYNLAVCYLVKQEYKLAETQFKQILKHDPNHIDALYNLGFIALRQGERDKAKHYYNLVLDKRPDDRSAQYTLAALTQQGIPDKAPTDYIRRLYDSYAAHYEKQMLNSLHYQVPNLIRKKLNDLFPTPTQALTIVDMGCGSGLMAHSLKPYAKRLIGVDLSDAMLACAAVKELYDDLQLEDMAYVLQCHKQTYDLICAADVLIYQGDLQRIFNLSQQALKPNGYLIFTCEASETDDSAYQLAPSGRYQHTLNYLQQSLQLAEFKNISIEKVILRQQAGIDVNGYLVTANC